jgi:hypothetical protein
VTFSMLGSPSDGHHDPSFLLGPHRSLCSLAKSWFASSCCLLPPFPPFSPHLVTLSIATHAATPILPKPRYQAWHWFVLPASTTTTTISTKYFYEYNLSSRSNSLGTCSWLNLSQFPLDPSNT